MNKKKISYIVNECLQAVLAQFNIYSEKDKSYAIKLKKQIKIKIDFIDDNILLTLFIGDRKLFVKSAYRFIVADEVSFLLFLRESDYFMEVGDWIDVYLGLMGIYKGDKSLDWKKENTNDLSRI